MFIHLVTAWKSSWAGIAALHVEVEYCYTVACCQLGVARISFLAVHELGSHFMHHLGVYILYIWVYMAIYSHIYMFRPYIYIVLIYIEAKGCLP